MKHEVVGKGEGEDEAVGKVCFYPVLDEVRDPQNAGHWCEAPTSLGRMRWFRVRIAATRPA